MRRLLSASASASSRGLSSASSPRTALALRPTRMSSSSSSPSSPRALSLTAARRLHATAQQLKPMDALASTATSFPTTHDPIPAAEVRNTPYFLDNKFVESKTDRFIDLHDPATNSLVTRVPQMTTAEMRAVVESSQRAFQAWKNTTVLFRQQIMFRYVQLIKDNWDRLAASITLEQGKTFADAKGDVLRGLQVAEAAIGAPELLKGEVLEVSKDMETRTYREPLGVTAAICPFSEFFFFFFFFFFDISHWRRSCESLGETRILLTCFLSRLPCHDSPVVNPHCHHYRQHHHRQAVGA